MQRLAAQRQKPFGSTYLHSPNLDAFVEQQWKSVPGLTVVKAHELGPRVLQSMQSGNARGVCTFRDPRDCVASDLVFMGRGLETSIHRVSISLECLRVCETIDHVLFVRYEEMMTTRRREISRIARHLGINADVSVLGQVDAKTNLSTSKKVCEKIRDCTITQVFAIDSHRVDPQTHLHENHIDSARVGRWRDELSLEQGQYLTELFAPWLLKWGYETQASMNRILSGQIPSGQILSMPTGYFEVGVPGGSGRINSGMLGGKNISTQPTA